MQKVVTINLNGQAYQLDESAYEALRLYLDRASTQLADNPDRAEIMADLEQAIADKCQRYLNAHKTIVGADETARVLEEMGPVETDGSAGPQASAATGADGSSERQRTTGPSSHRFYRIRDGAMIAGLCNGAAAYFDTDVTVIRVAAVLLALLDIAFVHTGLLILGYVVLMFIVPEASTSEERAEAHGTPFSAQELVDEAKRHYAGFRARHWNQEHEREWRRKWRRRWRHERRHQRQAAAWWGSPVPPHPAGYAARVWAGMTMPLMTLLSVAAFWVALYAVLSLLYTGSIEGLALPSDVPLWVGILGIVLIYNAIAWPLHAARRAAYYALGGAHHGWFAAWDGVLSLGFGVLIIWFGYHYIPAVREIVQHLPDIWNTIRHWPETWNQSGLNA